MSFVKRTMKALALSCFVLVALAACTSTAEFEPIKLPSAALVERLPLRVGVYYDDELRNHHKIIDDPSVEFIFYLGPPTIELFDQILDSMFQEVVVLKENPSNSQSAASLDVIIEPKIKYFDFHVPPPGLFTARLTYDVKIYTSRGKTVGSLLASGKCDENCFMKSKFYTFSQNRGIGKWVTIAMQQAAAQFIVDFHNSQEIKDWLKGQGLATEGMTE